MIQNEISAPLNFSTGLELALHEIKSFELYYNLNQQHLMYGSTAALVVYVPLREHAFTNQTSKMLLKKNFVSDLKDYETFVLARLRSPPQSVPARVWSGATHGRVPPCINNVIGGNKLNSLVWDTILWVTSSRFWHKRLNMTQSPHVHENTLIKHVIIFPLTQHRSQTLQTGMFLIFTLRIYLPTRLPQLKPKPVARLHDITVNILLWICISAHRP